MLDAGGLDRINTLPKLLDYLRENCDWPIEEENFEDLVFDWDPKELGLKDAEEYREIEIKQLRPLTSNQPWGVFFVNFPKKDLKVTVLRRILGALTVKRRKSANAGERAAWQKHDLLFLSAYGDSGHRRLTFAHFQDDPADPRGIARLDVLGWNPDNTIRRLSEVRHRLTDNLRWPGTGETVERWRTRWSSAFDERPRESINTSKHLASALAALAIQIRDRAISLLDEETEIGSLTKLYRAFKEALIHDLTPHRFADMYAQTITYGLLATTFRRTSGAVTADSISMMALPTNPFLADTLKDFLQAGGRKGGIDFDELGVNDVVELLRRANMDAVLRDFDDRNPEEDPVIHFYESFLKEYDPKERIQRGVFYTPRPVVSFIVRSVDEVLVRDFQLEDGLADTATWGDMEKRLPGLKRPDGVGAAEPFVRILDPATGTGTFLVEVIDLIHNRMTEKWKAAGKSPKDVEKLWNVYVPEQLLPRLYAFELMMAPYAIAHMKVGLKLYDTGYKFGSDERARIFLTNGLEPAQDLDMQLAFMSEALAHEAKAANDAKGRVPFTIVIGNPPYQGISVNMGEYAQSLVSRYRTVDGQPLGERKVWLQNDYVKFFSFAQSELLRTSIGCIGLITDNSYLDGPTFRGMRHSLISSFDLIRLLDLGGKTTNLRVSGKDENVFDIQQGVSIAILGMIPSKDRGVMVGRLTGSRGEKARLLSESIPSLLMRQTSLPRSPLYDFFGAPISEVEIEYNQYRSLADICKMMSVGVQTSRDNLAVGFTRKGLNHKLQEFADPAVSNQGTREKFFPSKGGEKKYPPGDTRGWKLPKIRKAMQRDDGWSKLIEQIVYRPFDMRYVCQSTLLSDWPRPELNTAMKIAGNICLTVVRRTENRRDYDYFSVSEHVVSNHSVSLKDGTYGIPLVLPPALRGDLPSPNLDEKFIRQFADSVKLVWQDGHAKQAELGPDLVPRQSKQISLLPGRHLSGDLERSFGARDVFGWIYAIFHSQQYRERYKEFLITDFARVPFPATRKTFQSLVPLGQRLIALHLLSEKDEKSLEEPKDVRFAGRGSAAVEKGLPKWSNGRVAINAERWFEDVPENVWSFHVGGYQVCEKWLKDRRVDKLGRPLDEGEILHYRRIVAAISETIDLMAEIDRVIERHGGWPDAFRGMTEAN